MEYQGHIASPRTDSPNGHEPLHYLVRCHSLQVVFTKQSFTFSHSDALEGLDLIRGESARLKVIGGLFRQLRDSRVCLAGGGCDSRPNAPRCYCRELLTDDGPREKMANSLTVSLRG